MRLRNLRPDLRHALLIVALLILVFISLAIIRATETLMTKGSFIEYSVEGSGSLKGKPITSSGSIKYQVEDVDKGLAFIRREVDVLYNNKRSTDILNYLIDLGSRRAGPDIRTSLWIVTNIEPGRYVQIGNTFFLLDGEELVTTTKGTFESLRLRHSRNLPGYTSLQYMWFEKNSGIRLKHTSQTQNNTENYVYKETIILKDTNIDITSDRRMESNLYVALAILTPIVALLGFFYHSKRKNEPIF